jgi:hypothetical protein
MEELKNKSNNNNTYDNCTEIYVSNDDNKNDNKNNNDIQLVLPDLNNRICIKNNNTSVYIKMSTQREEEREILKKSSHNISYLLLLLWNTIIIIMYYCITINNQFIDNKLHTFATSFFTLDIANSYAYIVKKTINKSHSIYIMNIYIIMASVPGLVLIYLLTINWNNANIFPLVVTIIKTILCFALLF